MDKPRLHITTSPVCNNECVFCVDNLSRYAPVSAKKTRENILRNLMLNSRKVESVLFTSGEPTLNKDLVSHICLAKKLKYNKISLVTNGRRLSDKEFCRNLLAAGLTEVCLSIHGSSGKVHDKITLREGSFKETFTGLKNLISLKKRYKFILGLNYTVNKLNYTDLKDFLKKIRTFGAVDSVIFNVTMPHGRAKENFGRVVPGYAGVAEEFKKAVRWAAIAPLLRRKINICGLPLCLLGGFENYSRDSERLLMKNYHLPNAKGRDGAKDSLKRKECAYCKYYDRCSGVYAHYIKRTGWSEFKPVLLGAIK